MVGRAEITDKAWEQIAPLLPENGKCGGQWQDHRKVITTYRSSVSCKMAVL
jgi:hypothetical protein